MNRSHVIRLSSTPEQEVYFRKACGVARHAYNWALAHWKEARADGKRVKIKDLKAEYNKIKGEQFPWVYEVTKCAPEQAFSDLNQAFANYWRMKEEGTQPKLKHPRKDGEEAGFPHFKSKKRDRLSFYLANDKFSVDGHTLGVPKLGNVNMTEELRFQGKIMSATISYHAGWWFVSIAVEVEHETPAHTGGTVGIDLGIKTLATLSDGMVFENQRHYRQGLGRIKGLSRGLSRKVEGSQNWWKNTKKLAKAHYRVGCSRSDTLHKMTTHIARTYALIGMEDLNAKGMASNHCLAQAVSDASFFEVKRQLLYKAEQYGGYVQLVDRWYASSKTCSGCGWIKEDLTLADRVFICHNCGIVTDRDENAAITIRKEALRLIADVPVVASSGRKFARREWNALARQRVKRSAMKQVRRCRNYVLLHLRKQVSAMLTQSQVRQMQEQVTQTLAQAGIVLTAQEQMQIEVVDFGLSELERTGLQLVIYINNDRYCAKELVMTPRQTCAQHRHPPLNETNPGKQETFRCRWGKVWLYVEGETSQAIQAHVPEGSEPYYTIFHEIELHPGDQYTIPPNTWHWFQSGDEGAIVSEFSSPSYDEFDQFADPRIYRFTKVAE